MRKFNIFAAVLALLAVSGSAFGTVVIAVTTNVDEANSRTSNVGSDNYPLSQGCSLREAMQNIDNGNDTSYPECTPAPETGPTADNVIDLSGAGGTITVNSSVPDPTDVTGVATTRNNELPDVFSSSSIGKLSITGGSVSCDADPNGVGIFKVVDGDFTLSAMSISSCTAARTGVVVWSQTSSNLTLTNVNISAIRATNGVAGCIDHGSGNLTITNTTFTGCVVDDNTGLPGFGAGQGGALSVGAVGFTTAAELTDVTFTGNVAGTNGGAIYLTGTDAIAITNATFSGNIANGNTFDSGNAEVGGGAIYASNTATGGHTAPDVPSLFSIFNSGFGANLAPFGTGGAILLTGSGQLTYGQLLPGDGSGFPNTIPGGIIASNFSGNIASGTWDPQNNPSNRAGSGGAIYASGVVSIIDSSFVGGNTSTNASGGAIAYYDPTDSFTPMSIANTTFNGNSAAVNGGAIANIRDPANSSNGQIALINDTLSGDSTTAADGGGEIFNVGAAADVQVSNTILANGAASGNCSGPITDVANNLQFNPASGCASIANTGDPALQAPIVFGGVNALVFVMKLNSGSAASGTGDPGTCLASPIYNLDEALNSRPQGKPNCDVGAFESAIVPDLTVAKSHSDPFALNDVGDTYTITVSNGGDDSTSGTVTVTENLPAGLTATAMSGTGWDCSTNMFPVPGPAPLTCTSTDVDASSANYPDITLTVNVPSADKQITNSVDVAGGSESNTGNNHADDLTNVTNGLPVRLQSFEVD